MCRVEDRRDAPRALSVAHYQDGCRNVCTVLYTLSLYIRRGKTPRLYDHAVHGTSANDFLQFAYISIALTASSEQYVVMLRDDHSSYCWLFAIPDTSAKNAARSIIDCCAAFGVPSGSMSDGQTNFKNETLRLVAEKLRVPHQFTLPYVPWSNGGIERRGKDILHVLRSTASKLQLVHEEWPNLLPLVQNAINNAPSSQRAGVPPTTAMTGMSATPQSRPSIACRRPR